MLVCVCFELMCDDLVEVVKLMEVNVEELFLFFEIVWLVGLLVW